MEVLSLALLFASIVTVTPALLPDAKAVNAIPKGNAAFLYPETQAQINEWKANLTAYNTAAGAERAIRVLYVYSNDLSVQNTNPTIGSLTAAAANAFRSIPYVTHVGAIVDGYYDGTSDSNGDFNALTTAQLQSLADTYARLYCASAAFDGVLLDLEPFNSRFRSSMLTFTRRLSESFRNRAICRKPAYGKFLGFFVGPNQADATLYATLGPNGYTVVSGYDLDSPGPGLPETPEAYRANLMSCLRTVKTNANSSVYGKYSVALPFSASACEFELAISLDDPSRTIRGYPMYSATQPSYIPLGFDAINQTLGAGTAGLSSPFLGVTMWGFLSRDVKVSGYRHTPKSPFDTPGMLAYMVANMPRKQQV